MKKPTRYKLLGDLKMQTKDLMDDFHFKPIKVMFNNELVKEFKDSRMEVKETEREIIIKITEITDKEVFARAYSGC